MLKFFLKRLWVYIVEKEVVEGFGMWFIKGVSVVCGKFNFV